MEDYKKEFIEFMIDCEVLKFGDFVTKSGRKTPFFVNTGFYRTGAQLRRLGQYYARAIKETFGTDFNVLFGPAYKGIPLTVAATMSISELYDADIRYCSNRKEVKDHGDTGILLGSKIKDGDRVMIIEDVTTSGKSIEETFPIIKAQGDVEIKGLIVSLNRMERGKGTKSALDEIKDLYGFPTAAIVTMADVTECLYNKECNGQVVIDYSMDATTYFPTLDQYKYNDALMLGCESGEPVQAAANGQVVSISEDVETGTTMVMDLGNGYQATYGQLKDITVEPGQTVESGTILGYVSDPTKYYVKEGANLYFSMTKDGNPIDPMIYIETVTE